MFDGPGFLQKLTFMNGQVFYQAKKVRGVNHNLNTNVVCWNGQMIALAESGPPYLVDVMSLDLVGQCADSTIGAHPKIDTKRQRLVTAALSFDCPNLLAPSTRVSFKEYTMDASHGGLGTLCVQHTVTLPGFMYFHDFTITDNYYIFFDHKLAFNPLTAFILGPEWGLSQKDVPTDMVLVSRHTGEIKVIDTEVRGFSFHNILSREEGDTVVTEYIHYPKFFVVPSEDSPGCIMRTIVNAKTDDIICTTQKNRAWLEFPVSAADGLVYAVKAGGSGIVRYDPSANALFGYERPGWIFGEPFVMDRYVMSTGYSPSQEESELVVLDRHRLDTTDPIAVLKFTEGPVTLGYHGTVSTEEEMPYGKTVCLDRSVIFCKNYVNVL
jgi:carotenoid cleavage dioxygenase-like enzyme